MNNFTSFSKIVAITEASKFVSNDIMTVEEINEYLNKVGKKIPQPVADIVYLTAKYKLLDQKSIDDIRDANKSQIDKLAFKYDIPLAEMEDLWKNLKELKTNIRLLPQYQTTSERDAFKEGKLRMTDITIDLETSAGRNAVAKMYTPLINKIVNDFIGKSSLGRAELMSAGMLGFTDAMNDWRKKDDGKTVPFKTYASYRVRQQILNDINQLSHSMGSNQHAVKTRGSALDAISIDGFERNEDGEISPDKLAFLGVEDADHNLTKSEDVLLNELFKFIESKFKQRDVDVFYRYSGLNGYKKEQYKDISRLVGISQSNVRRIVLDILNAIKKNPDMMEILRDLQSKFNESLMLELMYMDKEMVIETLMNDDLFLMLEELNRWNNKNVFVNALDRTFGVLNTNEKTVITALLKGDFNNLDNNYKKEKTVITKFLNNMYPTENFTRKTDVAILDTMLELGDWYKKYMK